MYLKNLKTNAISNIKYYLYHKITEIVLNLDIKMMI